MNSEYLSKNDLKPWSVYSADPIKLIKDRQR